MVLASCSDDDIKAPGNPIMDVKTTLSSACFGDSLRITINASDAEVPLSTIHADLYFGEEIVSSEVVRTKVSGQDYEFALYVPYYANIPDGRATLRLQLQNINFTITEQEYLVPISHPDYDYLAFVSADSDNPGEYTMQRKQQYVYEFTDKLPQKMKGYIVAPAYGENGNELTFGYQSNSIIVGAENPIPFSNSKAGRYTISFNTFSFVGSPFVTLSFDGEEFVATEGDLAQLDLTLSQGEIITPAGFPNFSDWWIDPDYFTLNDDETLTFLPVGGKYRIIADQSKLYFRVYALNSTGEAATLADDGSGALWVIGENVGKPSSSTNAVGWTTENALCMAQVSDKVYQLTVTGGKTIDCDQINFKFFGQMGWGVELKGSENFTEINSSIVGVGDGNGHDDGNLYLLDGVTLSANTIYRFVVDLTGGINAAKFSAYADGEEQFTEKRAYLNGQKMTTYDNALYTISTNLSQGEAIELTGISDLSEYFFDYDYFVCADDNDTVTFRPLDGYYRITLNVTQKAVSVARLNPDGSDADYATSHAIYMLGWGVGFPNQSYQNGWSTDTALCLAEVEPNVFQYSDYAGPESGSNNGDKLRYDYVQFKFYQDKSWGHEYAANACEFIGDAANYINPDNGDFTYVDGHDVQEGDFITIRLDLTAGEDSPKFSFSVTR